MTPVDEQLERLISRRLDGELSEAEQAEFEQMLAREPGARRLYETQVRIDSAARDALRTALPGGSPTRVEPMPAAAPAGRRLPRGWWAAPLALAACLAAVVILRPMAPPPVDSPQVSVDAQPIAVDQAVAATTPIQEPLRKVTPAFGRSGLIDTSLQREWLGIQGSDGNIYWIQVDHARTFRTPGEGGRIQQATSEL
jgi:anti-sigma factor RsiW